MSAPAKCGSCGAPIEWAVTLKGKRQPFDFQRVPDGRFVLSHRTPGQPPVAEYQGAPQMEALRDQARTRGEPLLLFKPHHATCPDAEKWRKKR